MRSDLRLMSSPFRVGWAGSLGDNGSKFSPPAKPLPGVTQKWASQGREDAQRRVPDTVRRHDDGEE